MRWTDRSEQYLPLSLVICCTISASLDGVVGTASDGSGLNEGNNAADEVVGVGRT